MWADFKFFFHAASCSGPEPPLSPREWGREWKDGETEGATPILQAGSWLAPEGLAASPTWKSRPLSGSPLRTACPSPGSVTIVLLPLQA